MDRQEFSAMVKAARERKGISKYQVHLDSRLAEIQITRIERAENSFNMRNIFKILDVMNALLLADNGNKFVCLSNTDDIIIYIKNLIGDQSRNSICKECGIFASNLQLILEAKTVISIDTFLKLTNYFGYTLSIVDKEE